MGINMHQHRLPRKGRDAGIYLKFYYECGAFIVNRQELMPREFDAAEHSKSWGILRGFPTFFSRADEAKDPAFSRSRLIQ